MHFTFAIVPVDCYPAVFVTFLVFVDDVIFAQGGEQMFCVFFSYILNAKVVYDYIVKS